MDARLIGGAVSLSAGLDKPGHNLTEHDPDHPIDPHESHEWIQRERWAECDTCGMRDYYPGAATACEPRGKHESMITLDTALDLLLADLMKFRVWWRAKGLENERPTLDEWAAEWFEWRHQNTPRRRKR